MRFSEYFDVTYDETTDDWFDPLLVTDTRTCLRSGSNQNSTGDD